MSGCENEKSGRSLSRRTFLGSATAAAAFSVVPAHVMGGQGKTPPSEKLNIAAIGAGGRGRADLNQLDTENIVALCDIDERRAAGTAKKYKKAKIYKDFRRMLEQQKDDIDAVLVATADHTHAVATMAAVQEGKHVYTEKPLTHSVWEARKLREAVSTQKVASQMGNNGHAGDSVRRIRELLQDGAIGNVREVHCWTDRPFGWWPQGIGRPKQNPSTPSHVAWDLWLGPAPKRAYNPVYHPFSWRGWWDFGTGALGDIGCHSMDAPFFALDLYPVKSVEATFTGVKGRGKNVTIQFGGQEFPAQADCTGPDAQTGPIASVVHYEFPQRGDMVPCTLTWWDGGMKPPRPPELGDTPLGGGGNMYIGDKGVILTGGYGGHPRIFPESRRRNYEEPPKTLPRVGASHHQDWIRACKGGQPACSNFDYAVPLTEVVLLGNVALRSGRKLNWDAENMKVTNVGDANRYVRDEYRKGWSL